MNYLNCQKIYKSCLVEYLVPGKTDAVESKIKKDMKQIYSRPYPLPKVHV